jgi:hypothetical protein
MLQRYDLHYEEGDKIWMDADEYGEYVKYDEAMEAINSRDAEIARLRNVLITFRDGFENTAPVMSRHIEQVLGLEQKEN